MKNCDNHYKSMVNLANNYYYALKILRDKMRPSEGKDNLENYIQLVFPVTNLASLTCEIYLKALAYQFQKAQEPESGHDLVDLFSKIDPKYYQWCEIEFNKENNNRCKFVDEITKYRRYYPDWRYLYERGWTEPEFSYGVKPSSLFYICELLNKLANGKVTV